MKVAPWEERMAAKLDRMWVVRKVFEKDVETAVVTAGVLVD